MTTTTKAPRILAIDVLRGITIAFMILVNDPGDGSHVYAQLDHAVWNGWTLTDLVFPTFLFLVGSSTVFSLDARIARGNCNKTLTGHLFLRALKIFALKMTLTIVPYFHMTHLRIYGVLTRIALCYLLGGLILLATRSIPVLATISAAILATYWALMRFVPIPGIGRPVRDVPFLDMNLNLAAWLDRTLNDLCQRILHTGVLYEHTRDPEGLLSTLPAIANRTPRSHGRPLAQAERQRPHPRPQRAARRRRHQLPPRPGPGTHGSPSIRTSGPAPTSSWPQDGLWSASASSSGSSTSNVSTRPGGGNWLTKPFLIFGANAITAYAVSAILVKTMLYIKVHDGDKMISAWGWTYRHLFARSGSTNNTSLAFAIAVVAVCFIPNLILYRKRIFLKL